MAQNDTAAGAGQELIEVLSKLATWAILAAAAYYGFQWFGGREARVETQYRYVAESIVERDNITDKNVIAIPVRQAVFVKVLETYRDTYAAQTTDFQRGALKPQRAESLCRYMEGDVTARDWIGRVRKLSTNGDGHGVLTVGLAGVVELATWNNSLSDIGSDTLIRQGNPVHAALGTLKVGDHVRFSGRFFKDSGDCFEETSMTIKGTITEPTFVFKFEAVQKFRP